MENTKKKLSIYWDELISKKIPSYVNFQKIEDEIKEHFGFLRWAFKRIVLPIAIAYILAGIFLFKMNVLGSLVIALIVFLYSNFLPDTDFLIKETKNAESKWYEKYALLFFAPVIMYYILDGRKKPLYTKKGKSFHNYKTVFIWGVFLFIVGAILWQEPIKMAILPIFGMLGFSFHLMIDGRINNFLSRNLVKHFLHNNSPIASRRQAKS
ncbi:hypothetical protein HYT57_01080 [Candidatus Woesearchaeota archaeon]|nr:hypothetical protein [Candidatus Woesearchaeota archaeon]